MIALGLACENVAMIIGQPWYEHRHDMPSLQRLIALQDWIMANLLGHHECLDIFLRCWAR